MNLDALKKHSSNFTHRIVNSELTIRELEVEKIQPDPNQPRKEFDFELLTELAQSIKTQGLIQPIVVRKASEDKYYIISGERRYRATLLNAEKTIKAIVKEKFDEAELVYLQMAENLKRADLTVVEIAEFISRMLIAGEKQSVIAEKLGLNKGIISQYSFWADMPEVIREALRSKKLGSIQAAYALFKKWEDYPTETQEFIEKRERISQSEAKSFEPKSLFEQTFSEKNEIEEQVSESIQPSLEESNSCPENQETVPEPLPATASLEDGNINSLTGNSELEEEQSNSTSLDDVEFEDTSFSSEESSAFESSEEKFEEGNGCEEPFEEPKEDQSNESVEDIDKLADNFLETHSSEEFFKKPIILCLVEGRECELLYKKKPEGLGVFVKWENGVEEEIPAEDIEINRIIEG